MSAGGSPRSFSALLPALAPERGRIFSVYLSATTSALTLSALGALAAWGVGHAVVERTLPGTAWWVWLVVLVAARAVLTWHEMDRSHAVAYRVLARLRLVLFDSYSRSVPARRREHSGRAAAVAMDDIEKLEFFYAHTIAQVAAALTAFLAALVAVLLVLPTAGAALAAGAVLVVATVPVLARAARRRGAEEQQQRAELSTQIVDALGALREVLSYGLAEAVTTQALRTTHRATRAGRRRGTIGQLVSGIRDLIVTTTVLAVILVSATAAGVLGGDARISPATLPMLVALALAGVAAVADAATTLTQLHPLTASAARVDRALHRTPVVAATGQARSVPNGPLGLRLRDITFSYDDRVEAISAWSAEIRPGEHVGLAGRSGSGKSTLIALAARLWQPTSGTIELFTADGQTVPLRDVDEHALRNTIAFVDQEATLFHGTVRENLLRGAAPVSDDTLRRTLERVDAIGWAPLDLSIGQGGLALSGGQRARLALARALVRQPRILLIDEVTASLDAETERVISNALAAYRGTVLIASHRSETLSAVSRVIPVDGGVLTGTP
ncbi:ATP-binding cassette domain-containing protein [Microbacterium esteraromaticum]|uniref:ATP-binding cassette domain-containing protein n=1 Tax=Microbacterium esteraromaticum TaxID=57043 RepID=UPI0019D37650|nr:ABC transporter ATP-binding protein [Microbacterium esteraromaticum]MBN7792767.1 ABC transporter ATP-binding protein [Microbacterium esteraromaticum]